MRRTPVAAATLGAGLLILAGVTLDAEIRVLASPALKETCLELVPQFEKASGHKVVTSWAGTADILKRMKAGEGADLVVVAAGTLDELTKLGRIVPGSRVDIARSGIGAAVRKGAPRPDIGSRDALKRALLSAKSIAYSSGPSGVYLAGLFRRMGIAEELEPKLRQVPPGAIAGEAVARDEAEIGFQQVSELVHVAGIDYLGPLPPEVQCVTVFSGGIHAAANQPEAARALVKFLTAPAAAPVIVKNGLQPG